MMTNWWTYASNISNILDILKSHAWWISYHQPPPPALLGEESCCGSEDRQPHLRKTPPKWGQNPFLKSYDMIKPGDVTPLAMVTFKYICIHILIYYIYIYTSTSNEGPGKKEGRFPVFCWKSGLCLVTGETSMLTLVHAKKGEKTRIMEWISIHIWIPPYLQWI